MINSFDENKKEYIIKDMFPRRKWINYLWNSNTVCSCDQFGEGGTWSLINGARRQIEAGVKNVYIKDRKTGLYFSANRNYLKEPFDQFQCHVGLGYQKIVSEYKGIHTEMILTVPIVGHAVLQKVRVQNQSHECKEIDIYVVICPSPALSDHDAYGEANRSLDFNGVLYSHDGYAIDMPYKYQYVASSQPFNSYEVAYERFCGVYESYANPLAITLDTLSSKGINFVSQNGYIGAFQYKLTLKPGEFWETVVACGIGKNSSECINEAKTYASIEKFNCELAEQQRKNNEYIDVFTIKSPDLILNAQTNTWLKRQLSLGKDWGRLYGKGFRDVMQDVTAFVSLAPDFARERILDCLKRQFEDGNPIRMFEPDYLYPYNDGAAWIPMTVLSYIKESGDISILWEKIPYLKGYSNKETSFDIHTVEFRPYCGTKYEETVLEHIRKALEYLYLCRGERGLVKFLGGDWNDSLNNVGRLGKGESVWLSIATVKAIKEYIEILYLAEQSEEIKVWDLRVKELADNILKHGIDGDHIIYGFNDYGEKIGSDFNDEAKIFLNPQTWAVLADLTDKTTLEKFMDAVENRLQCDYGYLQCYPSYTKGSEKIGRVSYFKPGLVENGAVYNHGVAFKIVADCILGRGNNAYETLRKIRFDNPKNPNNGMEPYAVSNMYMGPENKYIAGYAPMSWVTGTAGWLYRCITEYICGVKPQINGLEISPCFPSIWQECLVTRMFRNVKYNIHYVRSNKNRIFVNGEEFSGKTLPLGNLGDVFDVRVEFSNGE